MDLERAMEFLLDQQAAQQARFDAQMAVVSATLEKISEHQQKSSEQLLNVVGRQDAAERQIARTDATLRRAIRLSVEEHRRERVRLREMHAQADARMAAIEGNMAELTKSLRSFIDSLKHPRNGDEKV